MNTNNTSNTKTTNISSSTPKNDSQPTSETKHRRRVTILKNGSGNSRNTAKNDKYKTQAPGE